VPVASDAIRSHHRLRCLILRSRTGRASWLISKGSATPRVTSNINHVKGLKALGLTAPDRELPEASISKVRPDWGSRDNALGRTTGRSGHRKA
jgi:hypothetical protein